MVALAKPSGPAPTLPGVIPISAPWTYKLCAEDHPDVDDPRENKPVAILPDRASHLKVITLGGQLIHEFRYEGSFSGGGHRYYSVTKYGFELADMAEKKSGTRWVLLQLGNRKHGPIEPGYRWGTFR